MFTPSQNITRHDALESIEKRFTLSNDVGRKLLNYFYPIAFWNVISVNEYQTLINQLLCPTDQKIKVILGEIES